MAGTWLAAEENSVVFSELSDFGIAHVFKSTFKFLLPQHELNVNAADKQLHTTASIDVKANPSHRASSFGGIYM